MKALVAERDWLMVVLLAGYAPDPTRSDPTRLRAGPTHVEQSLATLAARTHSELETLLRRRLKALQYRQIILGDSPPGRASHSAYRTNPKCAGVGNHRHLISPRKFPRD